MNIKYDQSRVDAVLARIKAETDAAIKFTVVSRREARKLVGVNDVVVAGWNHDNNTRCYHVMTNTDARRLGYKTV